MLSLELFSLKICVKLECCPIKWAYQLYDSISQSVTQILVIIIWVDKIYYSKITMQNNMFQVP